MKTETKKKNRVYAAFHTNANVAASAVLGGVPPTRHHRKVCK